MVLSLLCNERPLSLAITPRILRGSCELKVTIALSFSNERTETRRNSDNRWGRERVLVLVPARGFVLRLSLSLSLSLVRPRREARATCSIYFCARVHCLFLPRGESLEAVSALERMHENNCSALGRADEGDYLSRACFLRVKGRRR